MKTEYYRINPLTIKFVYAEDQIQLLPTYQHFSCNANVPDNEVISCSFYYEDENIPELFKTETPCYENHSFTVYQDLDQFSIYTKEVTPPFGIRSMFIGPDNQAKISIKNSMKGQRILLDRPFDELIYNYFLYKNHNGFLCHASAAVIEGTGVLFIAPSGGGKTTMANICNESNLVLNDERVALFVRDGRVYMSGTPFANDNQPFQNSTAELKFVFMLAHGKENMAYPVEKRIAIPAFLDFYRHIIWGKAGLEKTLEVAKTIVDRVSVYRLMFLPDARVVDYIKKVIGNER